MATNGRLIRGHSCLLKTKGLFALVAQEEAALGSDSGEVFLSQWRHAVQNS
jgi:hypothetical protein